jgi:hypothetical protein
MKISQVTVRFLSYNVFCWERLRSVTKRRYP